MTMTRHDRMHGIVPDSRSPGQRDRDRVLYTEHFQRLADITQVLSPQGYTFHNRLTHTLKVAQVARRMTETLRARELAAHPERAEQLDPDVAEAAAFIHDLGHPPFGHRGEHVLDEEVRAAGDDDGFEGNAQSFRIVTALAEHSATYPGLNLTRATLRASLKYPTLRAEGAVKFGAYRADRAAFDFARAGQDEPPSLEAQIMDYADDVAYSTHDVADFARAGMLPLEDLSDAVTFHAFFGRHRDHLAPAGAGDVENELLQTTRELAAALRAATPGASGALRAHVGELIGGLVRVNVAWEPTPRLVVPAASRARIALFKRVVWEYVITAPHVTYERVHQAEIVSTLYRRELAALTRRGHPDPVRTAADHVAFLTDAQARALYAAR